MSLKDYKHVLVWKYDKFYSAREINIKHWGWMIIWGEKEVYFSDLINKSILGTVGLIPGKSCCITD